MDLSIKTAQPRVSFKGAREVKNAMREAFRLVLVRRDADELEDAAHDRIQQAAGGIKAALKLAVSDPAFNKNFARSFDRTNKSLYFFFVGSAHDSVSRLRTGLEEAILSFNFRFGSRKRKLNIPKEKLDRFFSSLEKRREAVMDASRKACHENLMARQSHPNA